MFTITFYIFTCIPFGFIIYLFIIYFFKEIVILNNLYSNDGYSFHEHLIVKKRISYDNIYKKIKSYSSVIEVIIMNHT